jgi:hypothetical protein
MKLTSGILVADTGYDGETITVPCTISKVVKKVFLRAIRTLVKIQMTGRARVTTERITKYLPCADVTEVVLKYC